MATEFYDGTLYSWVAKRAGGSITVVHSCGKITGITEIKLSGRAIVAYAADGKQYQLCN